MLAEQHFLSIKKSEKAPIFEFVMTQSAVILNKNKMTSITPKNNYLDIFPENFKRFGQDLASCTVFGRNQKLLTHLYIYTYIHIYIYI